MPSFPRPSATSADAADQGWQRPFTEVGKMFFKASTSTLASTAPSDTKSQKSFWSSLARRGKIGFLDDGRPSQAASDSVVKQLYGTSIVQATTGEPVDGKPRQSDAPAFQKGFQAIASSFSILSGTIGNAIEEGLNLVETKASDLILFEPRFKPTKKKADTSKLDQQQVQYIVGDSSVGADINVQLKASRDVAMAMSAKAKLLSLELKRVKTDLSFTKERCIQLDEENKRLQERLVNGAKLDEEDLVRIQLETLLAEKARLLQENAYYIRENHFLREVIEYHQSTMQDAVLLEESIVESAEGACEPAIAAEIGDHLPEKVISIVSG